MVVRSPLATHSVVPARCSLPRRCTSWNVGIWSAPSSPCAAGAVSAPAHCFAECQRSEGETVSDAVPALPLELEDDVNFEADEDAQSIREAIRRLCSKFDDRYWRECDEQHRFSSEFYSAMAGGHRIGPAIPEEYGRSDRCSAQ